MCGDNVRAAYPLFHMDSGGSIPTSPLQFEIVEVNRYKARQLNHLWHSRLPIFKTGFCENEIASFAAEYRGTFYAVAIWTNPVARNLPQDTWLELRRMAIAPDAPRNTASRMLSVMARLIKRKLPGITNLISYQDEEVHKGTIYKAAGWNPVSRHKGGSWNRPNSKNLNGSPRTRPDLNSAVGPKIRWEKSIR